MPFSPPVPSIHAVPLMPFAPVPAMPTAPTLAPTAMAAGPVFEIVTHPHPHIHHHTPSISTASRSFTPTGPGESGIPPVPRLPPSSSPSTPLSHSLAAAAAAASPRQPPRSRRSSITPSLMSTPDRERERERDRERPRSRSSKLLPALPLAVNTHLTPKSRRVAVDYSGVDEVQIVISRDSPKEIEMQGDKQREREREEAPKRRNSQVSLANVSVAPVSSVMTRSPKNRSPPSDDTPPRPRRSKQRGTPDLLPPRPACTNDNPRAPSPAASLSTISDAPTPRATPQSSQISFAPSSSHALPAATDPASGQNQIEAEERELHRARTAPSGVYNNGEPGAIPMRKRESTQRRLDALRGLVANLDFNQPWSLSLTEEVVEEEAPVFWACGEPDPERGSRRQGRGSGSNRQGGPDLGAGPSPGQGPVAGPSEAPPPHDHGWPSPRRTPPRKARLSKSQAELRTPDPPRQRREVFNVASSGYSKCMAAPEPSTPTSTWRASISDDLFDRVIKLYGPLEIKRQEVMWEMCETEQAFIRSTRTVLRLFATPLKTPQGEWISGIPDRICDTLDHLETISLAHGILAAGMRDLRRKEVLDVGAFAHMFKGWVHRLDVHEWYLVHFEAVVALVEDGVRDPDNVFGEFVRMQTKIEEMGSMSLGSMLLKPVQRLMKYPLFLKRLLDATPNTHPTHPGILSLLTSTESIILNLQAAKAREDDFEQLKSLESRLQGLPEGFTLAIRGRKLIGSGQVVRVSGKELGFGSASLARAGSVHSRGSISSSVCSSSTTSWDFSASLALTPSTCRTSAFSVSSASSGAPSRNGSIRASPSSTFSPKPSITRSPSSASVAVSMISHDPSQAQAQSFSQPHSHSSRPGTPNSSSSRSRRKDEAATLLVFDDLVILAVQNDKSGIFGKRGKGWKVLSEAEGGIGKVAEVKDWSGWGGHSTLFTITTIPLSSSPGNPLSPITACLTIPAPPASPSKRALALSCPTLTALPQFISVLTQATATAGVASQYAPAHAHAEKEEEVLQGLYEEGYKASQGYAQ